LEIVLDQRKPAAFCIVPRSKPFHPFSRVPLAHLATLLFVAVNLEVLQVFFEVNNTVGLLEVGLKWRKSFNLPVLLEILARSTISGNAESISRPEKPEKPERRHRAQ
jgi:hypothetical protein